MSQSVGRLCFAVLFALLGSKSITKGATLRDGSRQEKSLIVDPAPPEYFGVAYSFRGALLWYTAHLNHGIVPAFDTQGDWRRLLARLPAEKGPTPWPQALAEMVTENQFRIRVNPVASGRRLSRLAGSTPFIGVYDKDGEPLHGLSVDDFNTFPPPLDVPLDSSGYPRPFDVLYRPLPERVLTWMHNAWPGGAHAVSISNRADRLRLVSQLSARVPGGGGDPGDARVSIRFANRHEYIIDGEGGMRGPAGKEWKLTPRAFMLLYEVISKYDHGARPGKKKR